MFFASDNWAGAHPKIAESLMAQSAGFASAYGSSALDERVDEKFSEMFEREVAVFFVATGTAANSLALASVNRTAGIIFCHSQAHIIHHEGGAVEFATAGAKLLPVNGNGEQPGKIDPSRLKKAIAHFPSDDVHVGQKTALSISQSTESGTYYTLDEIRALSAIARASGLAMHMDGARFANALAALDVTPAEMTWKSGVDVLAYGATKNGCWCAEAVVVMDPLKAKIMPHLRKRAANLFSKSRFIAAQFDALLTDDLWLDLARHANNMGDALRSAIQSSQAMRLAWPTETNQIFAIMKREKADALLAAGAHFYAWDKPNDVELELGKDEEIYRFVTSYATQMSDVRSFAALAG